MSEYFYSDTKESFPYIRVPKEFLLGERYKKISSDAKFLYSILLDRMCLSRHNGWFDSNGRAYIIFTVKEMAEIMGCGDKKVTRMTDELEEADLIERIRQGQGKPNVIFVKNPEPSKWRLQNRQNDDSGNVETTIPEPPKQRCNNTDINKTEFNNTDISKSILSIGDRIGYDRQTYTDIIKSNIDYDILSKRYGNSRSDLDEIVDLMTDTVCSKKKYIRVGGDDKPCEIVRDQLLKLNSGHIEYCMECLENNTTDVRNVRQYLLTTLYNAPMTVSHYYGLRVNHNMAYDADIRYG